jgi:hypothetical protein
VIAEIEDRGLGLSREELDAINARLATPPDFDPEHSEQLGLFVVSRLASRHDIKVSLRQSIYGGTTAVLLLPFGVIVREEEAGAYAAKAQASTHADLDEEDQSPGGANAAGRHRIAATGRRTGTPEAGLNIDDTGFGSNAAGGNGARGASPVSNGHGGTGQAWREAEEMPAPPRPPVAQPPAPQPFAPQPPVRQAPVSQAPAAQAWGEQQPPWEAATVTPWPDAFSRSTASPVQPRPEQLRPEQLRPEQARPAAERPSIAAGGSPMRTAAGGNHLGMPIRVPQASLAPQLQRESGRPAARKPGPEIDERAPDATRNMMMMMQQGWERGRIDDLDDPGASDNGTDR